jgi:TP901 family phage tail tape measure protein
MQLAELYVSVQPDTSKFGPRLVRDLERKYRNKAIEIAVKPDTRRFVAESRRAAADAGRHAGRAYNDSFNRSSSGIGKSLTRGTRGIAGIATGAISSAAKIAAIGIGAVTTATAIGFVKATNKAGAFDKTMRTAGTTLQATSGQMSKLTDLAIEMGAKTSFSAQGAADAMLALAKGGLKPAQIEAGALQETLTLATAGGLELGNAADYMVRGLGAFRLKAKQAGRVSSALAGAANASTSTVENMGLALSQVSATAGAAGLSIEETTAALAAFDNAGVRGSDAGTSLKTMLARLVPNTEKATGAFQKLGLITEDGKNKFFDANGEMRSMQEIAGVLEDAFGDLSTKQRIQAMNTVFGSDATRAATILMNEGRDGIAKYQKATEDRAAAEKLAKTATEGYAGAMERFKGSLETLQIIGGKQFLPGVTATLTTISDWLEDHQKDFETVFKVAAGGLEAFGETAKVVLKGLFTDLAGSADFHSFSEALAENQVEIIDWGFSVAETFVAAGQATVSWMSGTVRALGQADIAYANTLSTVGLIAAAFAVLPTTSKGAREALINVANGAQQQAFQIRQSGNAQIDLANTMDGKLSPALEGALNRMRAVRDTQLVKAEQREKAYATAKAVEDIGKKGDYSRLKLKGFNLETDRGNTRQRAFRGRVEDARAALIKQYQSAATAGVGHKAFNKIVKKGEEALYDEFVQMGYSREEARKLAKKYSDVPKKIETQVSQPGMGKAKKDTKDLDHLIDTISSKKVKITFSTGTFTMPDSGTKFRVNLTAPSSVGRSAKGGRVQGPGTGTSDSIMGVEAGSNMPTTRVSRGEWVINARSSEKHDALLKAINEDGLARGGKVGRRITAETGPFPQQAFDNVRTISRWGDRLAATAGRALGQAFSMDSVGSGTGSRKRVRWHGGTFTERYANTLKRAQQIHGQYFPVIQGGFRPRTSYSGTSHQGDAVDTAWNANRLSAMRRAGSYAWHRTPAQGFSHHIHGIPKKGFGYPAGSGKWQQSDGARGGNGLWRGGSFRSDGWAKVGEHGPELVQGNKGDKVTPLNQPIHIELKLADDLRYIVQGEIDDNNEFRKSMERLSR